LLLIPYKDALNITPEVETLNYKLKRELFNAEYGCGFREEGSFGKLEVIKGPLYCLLAAPGIHFYRYRDSLGRTVF